jgi:sugar phosphate isomerase/epimerase
MNLMALETFPEDSQGPKGSFQEKLQTLKANGFDGVQFADPGSREQLQLCSQLGMGIAASGRVNRPEESDALAEQAAADGYACVTLHVGWGLENDDTAAQLIESVLEASTRHKLPMYFETHRATITQDMWRTVEFVRRFPEMRFNGDFSHWYAGQEMVYGGFANKLAYIQPVLERVRFVHGRIANPGCIQAPVEDGELYVDHFRQLWTASFRGYLSSSDAADHICFTPELLAPEIFYARTFAGKEETDRWIESLQLKRIAEECFACAQSF